MSHNRVLPNLSDSDEFRTKTSWYCAIYHLNDDKAGIDPTDRMDTGVGTAIL